MNSPSLRDVVAAELTSLTAGGAVAAVGSARSTARLYAADPHRAAVHRAIIERYLQDTGDPDCDGQSIVVTAGVPGAGKSTAIASQVLDRESYRELDADIVKDYLLEQAVDDGIFDDLLDKQLSDRRPIQPRELAALVHRESTQIVDLLRQECISRNENLIVHGTLTWAGAGADILSDLEHGEYRRFHILDVEVPESQAQAQALDRWWRVRAAGDDALGGRFTPPAAISAAFGPSESLCAANARALFDTAQSTWLSEVVLTVVTPEGTTSRSFSR
ncbi:MAG: zeta toxin protein [Gordonia sp.]|nr:zeta toxin protein [Gordonia sp. (in: high G+C Gram-positive bacteria)]